jgi:uncharacterized protein
MRNVSHAQFAASILWSVLFWIVGTRTAAFWLSFVEFADSAHSLLIQFLLRHVGFLFLLVGLISATRFIMGITVRELVTDSPRFRFLRACAAAGLWVAAAAAAAGLVLLFNPDSVVLTFSAPNFFLFLPAALVLIPVQAFSEELLFRALPGRWASSRKTGIAFPVVLSGLIFAAAHLPNPEMKLFRSFFPVLLYYFLFGSVLMLFSLYDGGYELAVGIHIGTNLFSALILNYEGSVMPTPSVLKASLFSPAAAPAVLAVGSLLIWLVFFRRRSCTDGKDSTAGNV